MRTPTVAIVDYQAGNLRSVQKALQRMGALAKITSDVHEIERADGVVFPGQGASDPAMRSLSQQGLVDPIKAFIASGRPFLGVCLGLQLLLETSEEGVEPCLGVLKGRVRRLPRGQKIPHMGWNQVEFHLRHPVFKDIPCNSYFYFVHSYYAEPNDADIVTGTTSYEVDFCSAVAWDNVAAVQFHPEKSGPIGLKLYRNFIALVGSSVRALG